MSSVEPSAEKTSAIAKIKMAASILTPATSTEVVPLEAPGSPNAALESAADELEGPAPIPSLPGMTEADRDAIQKAQIETAAQAQPSSLMNPFGGVAPTAPAAIPSATPKISVVLTPMDNPSPFVPVGQPPQASQPVIAPPPPAADMEAILDELAVLRVENKSLRSSHPAPPPPEGSAGIPADSIAQWRGKDVRLLLPWFKVTYPATVFSAAAFGMIYGRERIGMVPGFGDSMIYNIRNRLADEFLTTESEWSFWMDDDMVIPFGSAQLIREWSGITPEQIPDHILNVNVLERLMSHGKKVVGGLYFGRRAIAPPMFKTGLEDKVAYNKAKGMTGELLETPWVATGALLVHRSVYLDIQRRFPHLGPRKEETRMVPGFSYRNALGEEVETLSGIDIPAELVPSAQLKLIQTTIPERAHWQYFAPEPGKGEDVMFCERARAAGHKVYVDTGAVALHIGTCPFGPHNTSYPELQNAAVFNIFQR